VAVAALAAAGLLCAAGWRQTVKAESDDGSVRFVSHASIGIIHGQKVRLSVSNTEESTGTLSLSFSYYLAHQGNSSFSVPFYETECIQVPRGEFRSSEVRREDLKTEGEPETGRAQMMVRVTIVAPAGTKPEDFTSSLEVIKNEVPGEESAQVDSKYRLIILAAKRSRQFAPINLMLGEKLSYTFFNPNEEGSQPVRVSTYVYDSTGRLLAQTNPVELRPGECYTSEIKRDDLRVTGEDGTGSLPVGTGIQVALMDGSVRNVNLHVSMERVDRTGSTSGGEYFTGSVTVSDD
jgi:hypothetical protein